MVYFHPLRMRLPVFTKEKAPSLSLMAGVLRYDEQLVLVDSGFSGEPDLLLALQRLDIQPQDVQVIINTHVHPDHIGNNRLFPQARILVSRVDYDFSRQYCHAMIETSDPMQVLQAFYPEARGLRLLRHATQAQLVAQRFWQDDVIGQPEQITWIEDQPELPPFMELWPTPGHTPGHYAVLLRTATPLLFSGDAMASRLFWRSRLKELVPRFNSQQFQESKLWVEQFDGLVMGGHDRPFWSTTGQYCESEEIRLH